MLVHTVASDQLLYWENNTKHCNSNIIHHTVPIPNPSLLSALGMGLDSFGACVVTPSMCSTKQDPSSVC